MSLRRIIVALLALGIASCAHLFTGSNATVKQHMQEVTIPASNTVFAVAGEAPKDDAEWKIVRASALALAESGQWLLDNAPKADSQIWRKTAKDLADAAKAAALAAEAKDSDNVSVAGNTLYEACESCHASYLNKPVPTK
jgi:cytochrome c556